MSSTASGSAALPPAPGSGRLRFAHLSDPHLTRLDGISPLRLRDKRLLGWLSWTRRRRHRHRPEVLARVIGDVAAATVDHTVVTGDLTQLGLPAELDAARAWLEALGPPERVTVIPGNHDRYVEDPTRHLERAWAPWLAGDGPGRPALRLRGPVAFLALDSAVASPPVFATGAVGADQLARCAALLEAAGKAGWVRVVLVHHAPHPGGDRWRKRLVDAPALARVLEDVGAELVLHGHGHRARVHRLGAGPRSIPAIAAPSASMAAEQADRSAGWNLVTVERSAEGARITVEQRIPGRRDPARVHVFPEE
jgi:3',5'-cyclic AMP phosphodiesterase CpdA